MTPLAAEPIAVPQRRAGGRFDPLILLWIVLAAILAFLVINPLLRLVLSSLEAADTGAFTLQNYVTAYGRPR